MHETVLYSRQFFFFFLSWWQLYVKVRIGTACVESTVNFIWLFVGNMCPRPFKSPMTCTIGTYKTKIVYRHQLEDSSTYHSFSSLRIVPFRPYCREMISHWNPTASCSSKYKNDNFVTFCFQNILKASHQSLHKTFFYFSHFGYQEYTTVLSGSLLFQGRNRLIFSDNIKMGTRDDEYDYLFKGNSGILVLHW